MKTTGKADVAAILGRAPTETAEPPIDPKWRQHHQTLLRLRDQITGESKELLETSRQDAPATNSHLADAGLMEFDREMALSLLNTEQESLQEVSEAIRRIETGSYGLCEETGQPIPAERLKAVPWTRRCAEAQRALERGGRTDAISS